MKLTPGSRAHLSGEKYAHIIRTVDGRLALPWCGDVEGIALLAEVGPGSELAKLAPKSMRTCVGCEKARGQVGAA
jgi:hypothetical protein